LQATGLDNLSVEPRPWADSTHGQTHRIFNGNVCIGVVVHYENESLPWMACSGGIPRFRTWQEVAKHMVGVRLWQGIAPNLGVRKCFNVGPGWECKIHVTDVDFLEINQYGSYGYEAQFFKGDKLRAYYELKSTGLMTRDNAGFEAIVQVAIIEAIATDLTGFLDDLPRVAEGEPFHAVELPV
jgi:hypothetical protein